MVTMSNIAEQFKALKPGPQRAEALTGIMRDLSNWELRYVKDVICDNQFDFDIVGNLPLELVICIFSYLDTTAPFRYQVVSKQWREVLSSEQLRASSLSKWYSNSDPPLEGEKPEYGRSNYEIQRLKLEHMQRFRLGKPSSQTVIRLPDHLDIHPQLIGTFDFFHDHVAWCLAFQTIYVMNLRTGKAFSVVGAAREQVSLILLTKDLIAFNTHSGLVYAVDLNTREKRHLRLPNPSLCALSGDGRTLAAIIERHMNETHSTILVWNYDTQKSTSFVIQHKESPDVTAKMTEREKSLVPYPQDLTVNEEHKTITVLFMRGAIGVQGRKYSYTGQLIQKWHIDSPLDYPIRPGPPTNPMFQSSEIRLEHLVSQNFSSRHVFRLRPYASGATGPRAWITFDDGPTGPDAKVYDCLPGYPGDILWKDVEIYDEPHRGVRTLANKALLGAQTNNSISNYTPNPKPHRAKLLPLISDERHTPANHRTLLVSLGIAHGSDAANSASASASEGDWVEEDDDASTSTSSTEEDNDEEESDDESIASYGNSLCFGNELFLVCFRERDERCELVVWSYDTDVDVRLYGEKKLGLKEGEKEGGKVVDGGDAVEGSSRGEGFVFEGVWEE